MRQCLEPKDIIGKTVTGLHFTDHQLVLSFGPDGYIHIESHTDWDERACIQEGKDLTEKEQHELGLLTAEESASYLKMQEEIAKQKAEEARIREINRQKDAEQVKANEIFTLANLLGKHRELALELLNPTAGHTSYNGGKIRPVTPEESAAIVSGDIPNRNPLYGPRVPEVPEVAGTPKT